jgi:hypothetical protein
MSSTFREKGKHLQKRGIWIGAIILLIAGFGLYLRILVVQVRWIGRKAVTDTPKIPPALFKAGMGAVAFDMQRIILKLLIQKALISKDDACQALRQMHDSLQRTADEDGTVDNVNAASAIRTVMLELGCLTVPDHH